MKELILITLFLACIIAGTVLFASRYIRVSKTKVAVAITAALSPLAAMWYCLYAFSLAFENHYDVKRGTLLWFMTMDNTTINDFPITKSIAHPIFNKIGGGGPGIAAGWEVEYVSGASYNEVLRQINEFLSGKGYRIKKVTEPQCATWRGPGQSPATRFFSAENGRGECLDLRLDAANNSVRIQVTVLF